MEIGDRHLITTKNEPLGIIVAVIGIVITVATFVIQWIAANNKPDQWSSWDDSTKEQFTGDALKAAFTQNQVSPLNWYWSAISTAGYTDSDYSTFMEKNEWIMARVRGIEKATGKKWDQINPPAALAPSGKIASLFSSANILSTIGAVFFVGIAGYMVYRAVNADKE